MAGKQILTKENALVNEPVALEDLTTRFKYDDHGELIEIHHPHGLMTYFGYKTLSKTSVAPEVVQTATQDGPIDLVTTYDHYSTLRDETTVRSITREEIPPLPTSTAVTRETPKPRLGALTTKVTDEDIEVTTVHDAHGRPTEVTRTASGGAGVKQKTESRYHEAGAMIALGQLETIETADSETSDGISVRNTYGATASGGYRVTSEDLVRNITAVEDRDAYDRTTFREIKDEFGNIVSEERFGYDAEGRLAIHQRKQTGVGGDVVEQTFAYDRMGRATETTLNNAVVSGAPATVKTKTLYDVAGRATTTYDPFVSSLGAFTVTQTDRLGRPERIEHTNGAVGVKRMFGYDRQRGLAYQTDGVRTAIIQQRDVHGRTIAALRSDGTRETRTWDAWDQETSVKAYGAAGSSAPEQTAQTNFKYSPYGRRYGTAVGVSGNSFLTSRSKFTGDGIEILRIGETPVPVSVDLADSATLRTISTERDASGRVISQRTGEGDFGVPDDDATYSETKVLAFRGSVPTTIERREPRAGTGASYQTTLLHDALGRVTEVREAGNYISTTQYDEAGNAVAMLPAGYTVPWVRHYDSRGLLVREEAPEGKTTHQEHDARGVVTRYVDEAGKETTYANDELGRVNSITYKDGSAEEVLYENITGQLAARKARNGKWFSHYYDAGGKLLEVRVADTPRSADPSASPEGEPWLRYAYDFGGRLRRVASPDAATEYDDPDWMGRPGVTRSIRYGNHSGLSAEPAVLDVHTQGHVWTVYEGERARWRMPAAGASLPPIETPSRWRAWIVEERDAAGNISGLKAAVDATATPTSWLLNTSARGPGRLMWRSRYYDGGGFAEQLYAFADGVAGSAPGPVSGDLTRSVINREGVAVAGSEVSRDVARRQALVDDLGLVDRRSDFGYDQRGRLKASSLLTPMSASPKPTIDTLVHSDFRGARSIAMDPADLAELGGAASDVVPASWTASSNDVHQYEQRTLAGADPRTYTFTAGRRTDDGVWAFEYDVEDRVTSMQSDKVRIEYEYDSAGRIVGRRRLTKNEAGAFAVMDDLKAYVADGLPAQTTWVWDPVVDRLVAIFREGESTAVVSPAANAGLVRQYVHSDGGYDEPVEIHVTTDGANVVRYMPVIDDAGSGSLHAVISGATGLLAERVLYADAYGDAPRYLHGALVDKIEVEAEKRADGSLDTVKVRVRLSEVPDESTVAAGLRVAVVNDANTVVATADGNIEVDDTTITVTLTASEWTSLITKTDAKQLEIAVTKTLRAKLWEGPIMPMPEWMLDGPGRVNLPDFPVVQRESLGSMATFITGIGEGEQEAQTLYEIHSLYLAASPESKTKLLTGFKAAPFVEPATGLAFFRSRWYDPSTGTWLTPDSIGYAAGSSNLYAGFNGDPVNNADPTGEIVETAWDVASFGLGIYQISQWDENTSGWAKALDVIGVVADGAAIALPFIPGGAGAALKAYRLGDAAHDLYTTGRTLDRALNTVQGIDQGLNTIQASIYIADDIRNGNVGWGTGLNALQAGIGWRSMSTRGIGGYRLDFSGGHATASMNGFGGVRITRTSPRVFEELGVMDPAAVKRALSAEQAAGNTSWAYSIHEHHIYPKWLGGLEGGPVMRIRGYEHISDLEPKLFEFMQARLPEVTTRNAAHVRSLLRSGAITQDDITDTLVQFYTRRYPQLSGDVIRQTLARGLR